MRTNRDMVRQKIRGVVVAVITAVVCVLGGSLPAAAATVNGSGNGLQISPVRTDLTIQPCTSKTISVFVHNVTNNAAELQTIVNDFVAGTDETGTPQILLDKNQYAPQHSLKRYVAPIGNVTVAAGQQKEVKVTVSIPKDAPAGGYFGVVRFAPVSAGKGGNVSLSASVGSLILVTVPGNYTENLTVASFDTRSISKDDNGQTHEHTGVVFTSSKNLNAVVRFNNKGDVQEQPFGKIQLKRGDTLLATYEINTTTPRGNVLPDSIRKFAVPLNKVGSFGRYTLVGNFGYGTKGQLITAKTTFYVIPLGLIIGAAILLILILVGIYFLVRKLRRRGQGSTAVRR